MFYIIIDDDSSKFPNIYKFIRDKKVMDFVESLKPLQEEIEIKEKEEKIKEKILYFDYLCNNL
jgi:hypothetical protein